MFVTVEGATRPVQSAVLSFHVETERWNEGVYGTPQVRLDLEVVVDECSGEDGALAPDLHLLPHAALPALAGLAGTVFDERSAVIEAWYGNDAPELEANRLRLVAFLNPRALQVEWTATYDDDRPFRFEGIVPFEGITLQVEAAADADRLLRQAWPALDLSALDREIGVPVDFGEDWPADRRRWVPVTFRPR